jgi:hypothetical protein
VKDLVHKAAQVAPLLKITADKINNKVRNIIGLPSLDGMKQSTTFLHAVVQTTPKIQRMGRWRRRRGIALFLRRWAPLD